MARINIRFRLRRDQSDNWGENDPVLEAGEPGYELDTHCLRIGNGVTRFSELPAISPGPKGDKGDPGPAGADGPLGLKGDMGPKGDPGPAGVDGLPGAKGDKGDTGPQGIQGIQGPTGDQGPMGPGGADGHSFNFKGLWDALTNFTQNDVVYYQGSSWIALNPNTGSEPSESSTDWDEMAMAGAPGAQGVQGPQGLQGPQGDPGSDGAQGPKGDAGPTGPQGLQGPSGAGLTPFLFNEPFNSFAAYTSRGVPISGATPTPMLARGGGFTIPYVASSGGQVYTRGEPLGDHFQAVKLHTPTAFGGADFNTALILKWVDANNWLGVQWYVNAAQSATQGTIIKVDAGVYTSFGSMGNFPSMATNADYWLLAQITGDRVKAWLCATDPFATGVIDPTQSGATAGLMAPGGSATGAYAPCAQVVRISGADLTKFGGARPTGLWVGQSQGNNGYWDDHRAATSLLAV